MITHLRTLLFGSWIVVAGLMLATAAQAQAPAPGGVQGGITVDGRKTELRYGHAVIQTSISTGKPETLLVVTDKPLSAAAAADRAARKQARERDGLRMLEVVLDKRPDDVTPIFIWVEPMRTTSSTRRHKVELEPAADKRIKGRVSMDAPWESFDNKYLIDLRFDVGVLAGK